MKNNKSSLKNLGKASHKKTGIAVTAVTLVFAIVGVAFLIIGYHDQVFTWMRTTGIAFLIIALIPLGILGYNLIQKKIDS